MICGIYLIWNSITQKGYVGQSRNIERRWREHIRDHQHQRYDYILHRAFNKYGIDKFEFYVLGEYPLEHLNEMEIKWIKYYNTFNKGYNMDIGGGTPPINTNFKEGDIDYIITQIKYTTKTLTEISREFNVTPDTISSINRGIYWTKKGHTYPIREHLVKPPNECIDCGTEIQRNSTRCKKCRPKNIKGNNHPNTKYNEEVIDKIIYLLKTTNLNNRIIGERTGVTDKYVHVINEGKSRRRENESYPIR